MAKQNRNILKSYFEQGDIPTEGQYADLIDSTAILNSENTGSLDVKGDITAIRFIGNGSLITGITSSQINISTTNLSYSSGSLLVSGNLYYTSGSTNVLLGIRTTGSIIPGGNNTWDLGSPTQYFRSTHTSNIYAVNIKATDVNITNDITASGNISGSNNIAANSFTGTFNGALSSSAQIATNISGAFTATSASFSTSVTTNVNNINTLNSSGLLSSSNQISTAISGAFTATSASFTTTNITTGNLISTNIAAISTLNSSGLLSSSNQISTAISGAFTLSSASFSTRLTTAETELAGTLISSSDQIATSISGAFTAPSASISTRLTTAETELAGTLISSSAQINIEHLNSDQLSEGSSNLYYVDSRVKTKLNTEGVLSGSAQIATAITGAFVAPSASISTRLTTAETELAGTLISSSAQIAAPISGAFTAPSASFSTRLTTAETELSNTLLSSSAQIATDISGAFTSTSASLASNVASNFKSTGQRSGNSFITGSLHLSSSTSDLRVDGTVGIGVAAPSATEGSPPLQTVLHIKSNHGGNDPTVLIEGVGATDNAALRLKNADEQWTLSNAGSSYSDAFLIRSESAVNGNSYPFMISKTATGPDQYHPLVHLNGTKLSVLAKFNDTTAANLLVSGNMTLLGPNGHITASGNIKANSFTGTFNGALSSSAQIATNISGALSTTAIAALNGGYYSSSLQNLGNITGSNISASALVEGIGFRTSGNSGFGGQVHVGGTTVSSFNTGQIFKATGTSEFTGDITGSSKLLIQKSSGEGTPSAGTSDVAIFQNNTSGQDASIAIIAADENSSQIHFGRHDDIDIGSIRYFHNDHSAADQFKFKIDGSNVITFNNISGRGRIGVGADFTPTDYFHAQGVLSGGGLTISSSNGGTILLKSANTKATLERIANDDNLKLEFNTAGITNWTLGNIAESDNNFYIYNGSSNTKFIEFVSASNSTHIHTNVTASGNISGSSTTLITAKDLTLDNRITAISGAFQHITSSIIDVNANTIRIGGVPFSKSDVDSLKEGKFPEQTARAGFTNRLQPEAIFGKHDGDYIKFTVGNRIGTFIRGTLFQDMNLTGSNNYFAVGKDSNTQLRLTGQITASSHISSSGTITANKGVFGVNDSEQSRVIITSTGHITASGNISASGNITAAAGTFGTGTTTINDNISSSGTLSSSGIFVAGNVSAVSMSGDGSGLTNLSATVPTGTISSSLQTFTNITASGNISASGTIIASNFSGTTSGTNTGDQNIVNLAVTGSNVIFGNITSSNNISSSGTVTAAAGTFGTGTTTINDNINTTGNITASGNIKAGGNISASGDILGNTIIANNIVFYSGSTSIKIEAPDEVSNTAGSHLTLEAGNAYGSNFDGGDLILNAGKGSGAGVGGDITLNTFGVVAGGNASDSGSFTLNSKNFSVSTTGNVTSSGAISASGKLTATSLNTGQGDYELYNMNQNVTTTSNVTFNNITASINLKVNGDTILGNQESDTHTFNGNITASGNISSSHASIASFGSMKLTNLPTTKPTTTGSLWLSGSAGQGSKFLVVFTG